MSCTAILYFHVPENFSCEDERHNRCNYFCRNDVHAMMFFQRGKEPNIHAMERCALDLKGKLINYEPAGESEFPKQALSLLGQDISAYIAYIHGAVIPDSVLNALNERH